jgi:hypothetical protein
MVIDAVARPMARYVAALIGVALASVLWHCAALIFFTRDNGELRGLIAHPKPLDYVNYIYTANGRYYEAWAFRAPAVLLIVMVPICLVGSFSMAKQRRFIDLTMLWCAALMSAAVVGTVMFYTYCIAVDVFV